MGVKNEWTGKSNIIDEGQRGTVYTTDMIPTGYLDLQGCRLYITWSLGRKGEEQDSKQEDRKCSRAGG